MTLPHADVPMRAIEIFEFVIDIDYFSNILTGYRILFTILVIVVSVERSFSILKLLRKF